MRASARQTIALFLILVGLDVAARLSAHAPNFTPLAASSLFASFLFESTLLAGLVPVAALAVSDRVLGGYDWHLMATVYLALAFPVLLGPSLKARLAVGRVFGCALLSSVVFFVTTNFAIWLFAGFYARDIDGLLQCYLMAVPFFKNTLYGDLIWTGLLFGSYAIHARLKRGAGRCHPAPPAILKSSLGNT